MRTIMLVVLGTMFLGLAGHGAAQGAPFPLVSAVPLPDSRIGFEIAGHEIARYHYGEDAAKPYVFPIIGPAGRRLTRLTHPHDPHGHRHHLSIWAAHQNVNGVNFWEEGNGSRIVHDRIDKIGDGPGAAFVAVFNRWIDPDGKPILDERRKLTLHALDNNERYLDIELQFVPSTDAVVLGKTPFGFLGVRVAKTMSTNDGGGTIRNSEGLVNESEVLWKRARWVDYTGPVKPGVTNGIAIFDHPDNPGFPTHYHVRGDGWMGASLTYEGAMELAEGETLKLCYRLFAHGPDASPDRIDAHWKRFAGSQN